MKVFCELFKVEANLREAILQRAEVREFACLSAKMGFRFKTFKHDYSVILGVRNLVHIVFLF